jgi:hypothetical protein
LKPGNVLPQLLEVPAEVEGRFCAGFQVPEALFDLFQQLNHLFGIVSLYVGRFGAAGATHGERQGEYGDDVDHGRRNESAAGHGEFSGGSAGGPSAERSGSYRSA